MNTISSIIALLNNNGINTTSDNLSMSVFTEAGSFNKKFNAIFNKVVNLFNSNDVYYATDPQDDCVVFNFDSIDEPLYLFV